MPWERSAIQSCVSLLSSPGETQTLWREKREQRMTEMKHYECLWKPQGPLLLSGEQEREEHGEHLDARVDFGLNKRHCLDKSVSLNEFRVNLFAFFLLDREVVF